MGTGGRDPLGFRAGRESAHKHASNPGFVLTLVRRPHTQPKGTPVTETTQTKTWPDLAIGLYDRLTGRNAEITYDFEDMRISVPSGTGTSAEHADWTLSGTLTIRTQDNSSSK